ncbi:EF-P beta-lysylation protein EpmB [Aliidiomarina soli]|uniref:L-lysine 2,3-aminomutase n=1 Tax=Aliidiomarina soli TaxID=1928574 RepID=A0A432WFS3_9GAMM|nr:EF-P beta-lysylation protein EpmB [Aliidiomarina soli]RUO32628.1 EF-P beta-lysylation protein EpmB [Aliidiomarina soli]
MQPTAQQVTPIELEPSWQHQLADAYTDPQTLGQALQLDANWVKQHAPARQLFSMRVPKHFVSLMQRGDPNDPLLRQVWPHEDEFTVVEGYSADPLGEESATAASGILHKYQSRLLLILRGGCAVNCRYCFRRHFPYAEHKIGRRELERVHAYILQHPEVNEVILSGGDPLMANDEQLSHVLDMLERLPQITRVRIHSRLPVVIPQRLTQTLGLRLERSRLQVILVIHANHGNEISPALSQRLAIWRQRGIHLLNQSVLLKGVNDSAGALAELSEKLFASQVMPYYLHQLDKVAGAAHFAVSDANASLIMHDLLRTLPGFLVPRLVREIAGEASKTPLHF